MITALLIIGAVSFSASATILAATYISARYESGANTVSKS